MIVLFYLYTIPRFNYQNAYNSTVHLNVRLECVAMWLYYLYEYILSMNTLSDVLFAMKRGDVDDIPVHFLNEPTS